MWALGLYKSVVLVLFLLRETPVQEAAAELFGISQSTVSRRWRTLCRWWRRSWPAVSPILPRRRPPGRPARRDPRDDVLGQAP
ncbi:transposase family protein [Streptomyces sp. NPDC006283]|uniref:transposase family protein n=1 Tax=Streptomyces sp. NPDC006283 TaxID=3156741 RepID=UPI0033B6667A